MHKQPECYSIFPFDHSSFAPGDSRNTPGGTALFVSDFLNNDALTLGVVRDVISLHTFRIVFIEISAPIYADKLVGWLYE